MIHGTVCMNFVSQENANLRTPGYRRGHALCFFEEKNSFPETNSVFERFSEMFFERQLGF